MILKKDFNADFEAELWKDHNRFVEDNITVLWRRIYACEEGIYAKD